PPTPGGSPVPRANTTSTSGHGSAEADGTGATVRTAHVVTTAAPRTRAIRRALTSTTSRRVRSAWKNLMVFMSGPMQRACACRTPPPESDSATTYPSSQTVANFEHDDCRNRLGGGRRGHRLSLRLDRRARTLI